MNYNHEIIDFATDNPFRLFINKIDEINSHWHQSLEISVLINGRVELRLGDQVHSFKKGDVFLINPNEIHSLFGDNTLLATFQVRLDKLEHLPSSIDTTVFENNLTDERGEKVKHLIASLLKHNSATLSAPNKLLELSLVYRLLHLLLLECVSTTKKENKGSKLDRLSSILSYINNEYARDISLGEVAKKEYLSEAYLSRYFKENVGMNFSSYLRDVRLGKAMDLLLYSSLSIEEIAIKSGFPNTRSFVSAFKEKYGTYPSKYRKERPHEEAAITPIQEGNKDKAFNYLDDTFEEDRAMITRFITRYTDELKIDSSSPSSTSVDRVSISLDKSQKPIKENGRSFLNMIGGGRVKDLLSARMQENIRTLQKEIGFRYIKLHSVFDDDMMVVTRSNGKLVTNFSFVDQAYDFLMEVGLKPMVQLSFLPSAMLGKSYHKIFCGKTIIGYPRNIKDWNGLCGDFLKHLINRYGKKEVDSWLFTVWNEPSTSNDLFGLLDEEFYSLYENSYKTLKAIDPDLRFGGPSALSAYGKDDLWLFSFLEFAKEKHIEPDFITVHYYDIDLSWLNDPAEIAKDIPNRLYLSEDDDGFKKYTKYIVPALKDRGYDVPIYLSEWNNTVSHKDLLSDTCFKSAYIAKNLSETLDALSSFSYWAISDQLEENFLPEPLFHGGLGLFAYNGIKKPSYYAFLLLSKLGKEIIAKGDGYVIARDEQGNIQILLNHYVRYSHEYAKQRDYQISMRSRDAFFRDHEKKGFAFHLNGFQGKAIIKETVVNSEHGSAYDSWVKTGDVNADMIDKDYLQSISVPMEIYREKKFIGDDELSFELAPLEIRLIEIKF